MARPLGTGDWRLYRLDRIGEDYFRLVTSDNYAFFFETLPEDVRAAVTWMQANPLKGAYPGWIGRV